MATAPYLYEDAGCNPVGARAGYTASKQIILKVIYAF
jgi:hypothetical protein